MIDPTLAVSFDRTSLPGSLAPLEFSASLADAVLGIVGYQAPARQSRVTYAPDSMNVHGSEAIGGAWQQAILGLDYICPNASDDEAIAQAAYAEVVDAVGQFRFVITTQVSGAPAELWAADMGSAVPPKRTYVDLAHPNALVVALTIPVYPIPGSA